MKSIYERAMGSQFHKLHPKLQEKFGISSGSGRAAISTGVMEEISGGSAILRPFFKLGTKRKIVFPERGRNIPFVLHNYAYQDTLGRECVVWARSFHFPKVTRHFDATMIYSEKKNAIVDYFGTHQDFVSDLAFNVEENGGLTIVSKGQRIISNRLVIPLPSLFQGKAVIREWYDDTKDVFYVHVNVRNPIVGTLFEYKGFFRMENLTVPSNFIPDDIRPVREEGRE